MCSMFSLPTLPELVVKLIILLLAIPIHEWAHAWSAYQLGDDTASQQGRMTLNPIVHLDPIGSLLLLFSNFGWGKPVPVNPYRMRTNPRVGMAISAAAGPLSNFVLAMLLAIPLRMGWIDSYAGDFSIGHLLLVAIGINLSLMLFNFIPIYPLDGEKILMGLLPPRWGDSLLRLRPFGMLILAALIFILPRMGVDLIRILIMPVYRLLWSLLLLF
ncbi:MAG: site-2 protease family protein [Ardenticatenia bacterium]|nr:site-2 protease family protein [Ardenticatenia bacterium]MBL7063192.1 site-2 protease family protein [Anaerolineae bacterium]